MKTTDKTLTLERRRRRIRKRMYGTEARPRLSVYRSKGHIYAQIINAASTRDRTLGKTLASTGRVAAAKAVGLLLAERAKAANILAVVFDRGGRVYHGRVKALADASREGGLQF